MKELYPLKLMNSGKIVFSGRIVFSLNEHCTIFATYFELATGMHPMVTNPLTYSKTQSKSSSFSLNKFPSGPITIQI